MHTKFRRISPAFRILLLALSMLGSQAVAQVGSQPILIQHGLVVDGTGANRRLADIRIANGRIAEIGNLRPGFSDRVIEASGKVVAPGFIDAHSHADGGLTDEPDAETQIRQGITTAVVGQDGGSHFPLADYFKQLTRNPVALNIASFVGHGTVRGKVMKEDYKRVATRDEITEMRKLVDDEMQAGALGLSSGLEYDPGIYSTTDELITLAQAASPYGGIYISHVRDEENKALESFREVVRISEEGKLPAQISHIKLASSNVWNKTGDVFKIMSDARRHGQDVTADVYPYTYWQSTIIVLIPTRDWNDRAAWQKGLDEVGGAKNVLLSSYSPNPMWAGKSIEQIAQMTGKDAVTVIQEIVTKTHGTGENKGSESVVVTAMQESDLRAFIKDPNVMFCTDGGLHATHPRGAGSYPRVLGHYVRDEKLLSLEEAIRKMTNLPAKRFGFTDRGSLTVGSKADIVIFDAGKIIDTSTTEHPQSAPVGISHVLVNGVLVLDNGRITKAHPGEVLRKPGTKVAGAL